MECLRKFEYWRELVLILVMLIVLLLDFALFDSLWPYGEEIGRASCRERWCRYV